MADGYSPPSYELPGDLLCDGRTKSGDVLKTHAGVKLTKVLHDSGRRFDGQRRAGVAAEARRTPMTVRNGQCNIWTDAASGKPPDGILQRKPAAPVRGAAYASTCCLPFENVPSRRHELTRHRRPRWEPAEEKE